jgi:hypothetical protein
MATGSWIEAQHLGIGAVIKKALNNPIFRAIVQIVACAALPAAGCALAAGALSLAAGGSLTDALKAFAFSFAQIGAFEFVGPFLNPLGGIGGALIKAGVHGIIGGAISVAQGGTFLQGFAGSAAGALGGFLAGESGLVGEYGDRNSANQLGRALISAAAGCAGAVISGGKCAQAAVTAAFGSLYNGDCGGFANCMKSAATAAKLTGQWLYPPWGGADQTFGSDSAMTRDLMNSDAVSGARELYYSKLADGMEPDVTNYRAGFGWKGFMESGNLLGSNFSPGRFFVGSYVIRINTLSDGLLQFVLSNTTDTTSFGHQFGFNKSGCCFGVELPSWNRPYPMGANTQTFKWTERRR